MVNEPTPMHRCEEGMALRDAQAHIAAYLAAAGCEDAAYDAQCLCECVCGNAAQMQALNAAQVQMLEVLVSRRAAREPLQYLIGSWGFLNFELAVGEGVLCPRADTECVVEAAAACLRAMGAHLAMPCYSALRLDAQAVRAVLGEVRTPQVLELCGGSGCIGLGIKAFCPDAAVTVLEKSTAALGYLRHNAQHALAHIVGTPAPHIDVIEGDLFAYHATLADAQFDLLISNPPYLTAAEMDALQPEVQHEPPMALAAGEDGLLFYRAIASDYARVVKPGGFIVLEIGWQQAADVRVLLEQHAWHRVQCLADYAGNDRCIVAQRR